MVYKILEFHWSVVDKIVCIVSQKLIIQSHVYRTLAQCGLSVKDLIFLSHCLYIKPLKHIPPVYVHQLYTHTCGKGSEGGW